MYDRVFWKGAYVNIRHCNTNSRQVVRITKYIAVIGL